MRTVILTLFLLLTAMANSSAEPNSCGRLMSLYGREATNCICKGDLKKFGIETPYKNLKLEAICDYSERLLEGGSKEIQGHFFLKGKQTFTGTLTRSYNDAMGIELLVFRGEKVSAKSPFFPDFVYLRFEDIQRATKHYGIPPLTSNQPCLEATITFTATDILTIPGDSDEAGNYLRGYESVNIGGYNLCKKNP